MRILLFVFITISFSVQCGTDKKVSHEINTWPQFQGISLLGDSLMAANPPEEVLQKMMEAQSKYLANPDDSNNIIWYGRRMGYTSDYHKAIDIFTEGMTKFPDDARFPRHRGHRLISIRKYDAAIADFDIAAKLIEGTENKIEPDGIPNARNTPVSTLHGNIWYHKGLAHYLQNDMEKALDGFLKCRASGSLPDNLVSSTHWIYMILRRQGRLPEAQDALNVIHEDMDIIENTAYHHLCLFYKGDMDMEALIGSVDTDMSQVRDALAYGVANWHYYNDNVEKAKRQYEQILSKTSWNSFGYIAAESDYNRLINQE